MSRLDRFIADKGSPIVGAACYTHNPAFVEIVAHLGYQAVWFEMEHAHISFSQAADLCRIGGGLGMLTMIRIPDSTRATVLRAAECGPDILDLPMANSPDVVREFVLHAKYAPIGSRGLFGSSRATRYTILGTVAEEQMRVNEDICLMAQIETREAAERADEICSVAGLDAIFLGPGDMSASFGVVGDTKHPDVRKALRNALDAADRRGLRKAMMTTIDEVEYWVEQEVELIFVTSDILCMKSAAASFLEKAMAARRRN